MRETNTYWDSETLYKELEPMLGKPDLQTEAVKAAILPLLREACNDARMRIREAFEENLEARETLQELTNLVDYLVESLYQLAMRHFHLPTRGKNAPILSVVAVGGYGRCQMFPSSDVDILFLCDDLHKESPQKIAEFILYMLWDLGFAVGHSVRGLEECLEVAGGDHTIATALLDARLICGNKALFEKFSERFHEEIVESNTPAFVEAKLGERDLRHLKIGDSRYVLEPNIKDGKGGLRDLATLLWLAKHAWGVSGMEELVGLGIFTRRDAQTYRRACDFLWAVRLLLHWKAGRAEEHLTFAMQQEISEKLRFREGGGLKRIERFMRRYFLFARETGNLTRVLCAALEEQHKRKPRVNFLKRLTHTQNPHGFVLDGERLTIPSENHFRKDPLNLLRLFAIAQEEEVDIHPQAWRSARAHLRLIGPEFRASTEAAQIFLGLLTSRNNPEVMLKRLNDSGILGRYLQDFEHITGQMQFDMYHVHTVDEHTLSAIGILHAIEEGEIQDELPVSTEVVRQITERPVLYMALLLHDVAKGRGGDHSVLGEEVAMRLCPRFGFNRQQTETAAWLVRWHLLMSSTAFKRDLSDPNIIREFVNKVQSPDRLKLLLLLTVADIRAVGPTIWNGWKGALLRELYQKALGEMVGSQKAEANRAEELKDKLKKLLPGWEESDIDAYIKLAPPAFLHGHDDKSHARIAKLLRDAERDGQQLAVDWRIDHFHAVTEVTVITPDQQGLFSKIAGSMTLSGADIVNAKIFTLKNGVAVDSFFIQDHEKKAFARGDRLARMAVILGRALSGEIDLPKEIATYQPGFFGYRKVEWNMEPQVVMDNQVSAQHTVVEVVGQDRPGFLYRVTHALAKLNVGIGTALISTYGARAVDVFYIRDIFGLKIDHPGKMARVQKALLEAAGA